MILQTANTNLIITSTIIVVLLGMTLIFLFLFIQKKKNEYFKEKRAFADNYTKALVKSQNEIRERALENISWEIHDNVGQLLSVSKMQLNVLENKVLEKNKNAILEVSDLVSQSLQDLRALSKSLNPVSIKKTGLIDAITFEIDRYNRLNFIKASLQIENKPFRLDSAKETILFRIIQETINNTVKHAKATEIAITLKFIGNFIEIFIKDNGVGFNTNNKEMFNGIGLSNMKGRANLINATYNINSVINKGTNTYIKCSKEKIEI